MNANLPGTLTMRLEELRALPTRQRHLFHEALADYVEDYNERIEQARGKPTE